MLKKAISTSRRLADLKTDSARMLYTWIIPHLDVEGRFYADPAMVKGAVVPRIKSFSETKISECLQDMAAVGLIMLYTVDGDEYLQLRKFEDHQNLRKDRESPSVIPAPQEHSGNTPGTLQEHSGNTPPEVKLREVKLREVKGAREKEEKVKFLDVVMLTNAEYEKLIAKYGRAPTAKAIEILNNAIMSKGYKYKSHYHTLIGWPMEQVKSGGNGNGSRANSATRYGRNDAVPDASLDALARAEEEYERAKAAAPGGSRRAAVGDDVPDFAMQ